MPPRRKPPLSRVELAHLLKYAKRSGKPFLNEEMSDQLGRAVVAVDKRRARAYLIRQGIIDPSNPAKTPKKPANMVDLFNEFRTRRAEWEDAHVAFPLAPKGRAISIPRENVPLASVFTELKEYAKTPKPKICAVILNSVRFKMDHEIQHLLRAAQFLRKAEASPRYQTVRDELALTRQLFEYELYKQVRNKEFGVLSDADFINLLKNTLIATKIIHARLVPGSRIL